MPQTGIATVRLLERLGHQVSFPARADVLRPDAPEHAATSRRRATSPVASSRVFAGEEVIVAPSASCVGTVREYYPRLAAGDPALRARGRSLVPRVLELSELLVGRLGLEDVGAAFPHRVTYHPTCHSLRALHVGDAPCRLLRAVRGLDLVELPERARVLRLRRHLRGQERRYVRGHAGRQGARDPRHARGGLRRGRQLVPDAHRRRRCPGFARVSGQRTSPTSWRLDVTRRRSPKPLAKPCATRSSGATSASPRRPSATSGRRRWRRCRTGRSCATRAPRSSGASLAAPRRVPARVRGGGRARRRPRALGARRGRGERDRRRGSCRRRAPARSSRSSR